MLYMKPQDIVRAYGPFKGVLHVGAHEAQERDDYISSNIQRRVWIEGNPEVASNLVSNINDENDTIINVVVSEFDDEEIFLNVASFDQSSSVLPLKLHGLIYRDIVYTKRYKTTSISLKTILDSLPNSEELDFINLDIQGTELRALKGLGDRINQFKAIYTEINVLELYEKCDMMPDLHDFLRTSGFELIGFKLYGNDGWGDALYIKK